jgi:hypothetical protein
MIVGTEPANVFEKLFPIYIYMVYLGDDYDAVKVVRHDNKFIHQAIGVVLGNIVKV